MKIVFFSHDDELEEFLQDAVTTADMVMTDAEDDAIAEVDEALEDEIPVALFLDFDTNRKVAEKINKHYHKEKELLRVIFTADMSVKELKKHQDSKLGANAYMRKPLTSESISELLMDLDWSEAPVFEYEASDDLFDSVPVGSAEEESDEDSSESEIDFNASELKMDTEVRRQLDRHHFNPDQAFDFSHPANLKVQAAFDSVFETAGEQAMAAAGADEMDFDGLQLDVEMTSDESDDAEAVVFDFDEDQDETGEAMSAGSNGKPAEKPNPRAILEQMESEREASLVGYRPPSLEPTGDIEIPDEFRTGASEDNEESEAEAGLEFAMPEDEDGSSEASIEAPESDEGLSFDMDDAALDLSSGEEETAETMIGESTASEGGLDLGMDDEGGALEFSTGAADADEADTFQAAEDSEEVGGLDLGDDGGDLELGADDQATEMDASSEDDDDFGSLDLSDDDDEDVGKTVVMNTGGDGLNFGLPSDDEASATEESEDTLAEDLLGADEASSEDLSFDANIDEDEVDEAAGAPVDLDQALTGITEDSLEEFDYTGSAEAADGDDFSDLGDLAGEGTDPTMLAGDSEFLPMPGPDDEDETMAAAPDSGEELSDLDFGGAGSESGSSFEASAEEDDILGELAAAPSKAAPAATNAKSVPSGGRDPILVKTYAEEEMVRHQGLIRQLREEREDLLKQIQELKTQARLLESENLGLRAELDEVKIEKSIMKKRHHGEIEEANYALKLAEEKREIFEERARKVQKEFDKLNQKVRIDFNAVKLREKELEGQLELLKMDSQAQVESRDKKILELKRKIDALEFNMENAHIKEQKSKEDKHKLEEKLHKVMKTLRSSIKVMEDDLEVENLLSEQNDDSQESERE